MNFELMKNVSIETNDLSSHINVSIDKLLINNNQVSDKHDALIIIVPITIIYIAIFITGLIGNISTCVVIAKNRSMHTATNYYLFSLAISDLLLLISGLPPEMYYMWSHYPYIFGETFCIISSFAAETSANATVLTITAFTVERYVAICHPFLSHTMSKLSRAIKYVIFIWFFALCLAIPQAIQFGIIYEFDKNGAKLPDSATCSVKWKILDHAFEISTIIFFVLPMTIITVLYILIGMNLRDSRILISVKRNNIPGSLNNTESGRSRVASQRNIIRMLVFVTVAFGVCWAPFHAQRLLAVYAKSLGSQIETDLSTVYKIVTYISGILYFLSTTVNPLLYNIMSNKFREAFKSMLAEHCGGRSLQTTSPRRLTYSSLSRYNNKSIIKKQEKNSGSYSGSDETQRLTTIKRIDKIDKLNIENNDLPIIIKDNKNKNININKLSSSKINLVEPKVICHIVNDDNCEWNKNHLQTNDNCQNQITIVTSLAKSFNEGCHNNGGLSHAPVNLCLNKSQRSHKTVSLGVLAERFRSGTKGLFTNQNRQQKSDNNNLQQQNVQTKIQHTLSIGSANTISNSSLQDLDETEFTGSELARYMGELNYDIIT
ncbi:hypothetical protein HCN44_002769 [Aphidius gifuensis]|uniref:G-protein coupled receptors family 1 profile domain-containing protein n=2 Tax=Aphidius gifuensis TaxID=684658 RepID=A0A834XT86_APHGI|nr:hypothetical protein HCN44_002769 [Aphidius gifuensis]